MRDGKTQHAIAACRVDRRPEVAEAERWTKVLEESYRKTPWPGGDLNLMELTVRLNEANKKGDKALEILRQR